MIRPLAILQAHLDAKRFPGKMLADLGGHPLLWWSWHAAGQFYGPDNVVIACPAKDVGVFATALPTAEIFGWTGPEADVLGRLAACAQRYRHAPECWIARITPDDWPPVLGRDICTLAQLSLWHAHETDPLRREHVGLLWQQLVQLEINSPGDLWRAREVLGVAAPALVP